MRIRNQCFAGVTAFSMMAMLVAGCSRQDSQSATSSSSGAPSPESAPAKPAIKQTANPKVSVSALEQKYLAAASPDEKTDLVYDLTDQNTRESLQALARLFQKETDASVKEDMVDSIAFVDGLQREKFEFLKLAIAADQPENVRETAIDEMSDLDDPRALAALKELLKDPSPKIQQAARDAVEFMQD